MLEQILTPEQYATNVITKTGSNDRVEFAIKLPARDGQDSIIWLPIVITGPTTLAALLNSLQMGFRTLAIEKRSSEVWNLLSAVKIQR